MKITISIILFLITFGTCILMPNDSVMAPEITQEDKILIATYDQVATIDEIAPPTEAPTEKPTEEETIAPTEETVIVEEEVQSEKQENIIYTPIDHGTVGQGKPQTPSKEQSWNGNVLNAWNGTIEGPSGKETYYNLPMDGVVQIMRNMGYDEANWPYWVRDDGCKMLGNYIMCAANLDIRPRGSFVESSLGTCIVCDTGGFAYGNAYQLDIATNW